MSEEFKKRMAKLDRDLERDKVIFAFYWWFCLLLSLGFLGLVSWAIIRLVIHFT